MATTTNYSWTTPDDTALVKDGAAAIRTLGSSADTTVKALNPGTTAGDVDYYTTSTAKARLGIGTAGQVLTVNSGATAPQWSTPTSGGMTLISTTTLTGASITLSSIPATYNNLQIIIQNYRPSTDGKLRLRMNGDSAVNRHAIGTSGSFNATSFETQTSSVDAGAASQGLFVFNLPNYANTTTWKLCEFYNLGNDEITTTNYVITKNGLGAYNQTGAISSIVLFPDAGTFTSGTVLLYGVK